MKKELIIGGLVAALAIPTAAVAAGHGSSSKSKATTAAPKTNAKGSAQRSGLSVKAKPSKTVPAGARTKSSAKPKAGTHSGRKPKTRASAGRSRTTVRTKRDRTTGTSPVQVTLNQGGGGSAGSGATGIGGVDLPVSVSGVGL